MGEHGKYRALVKLMSRANATIAIFAWLLTAGWANADCRQALALGLDISGSVDSSEYRLQIEGLAAALDDPSVIDAFLTMPAAPIRLFIYEWAGLGTQRVIVDWIAIETTEQLSNISAVLQSHERRPREVATALGLAMQYGGGALFSQRDCWQLTLDISGDGQSNIGPRPRDIKDLPPLTGVTVNALVIGSDDPGLTDTRQVQISELSAYFRAEVIRGPEAFVQTALGFDEYSTAIIRKLLRELNVIAVGSLR